MTEFQSLTRSLHHLTLRLTPVICPCSNFWVNELKEIRLNGSEKMVSFMENYIIFVILYRSMRLNDASLKRQSLTTRF